MYLRLREGSGVLLKASIVFFKSASLCRCQHGVRCQPRHNCLQRKVTGWLWYNVVHKSTGFLTFTINLETERGIIITIIIKNKNKKTPNNRWSAARCLDAAPLLHKAAAVCKRRWSQIRDWLGRLAGRCVGSWLWFLLSALPCLPSKCPSGVGVLNIMIEALWAQPRWRHEEEIGCVCTYK